MRKRVGAIESMNKKNVRFYGYGWYVGDEEVPEKFKMPQFKSPKIILDDGNVVWGIECWWGDEDVVKRRISGKMITMVPTPSEVLEKQT